MILCPKCGSESSVVHSTRKGNTVRRRRRCDGCAERWSTLEVSEPLHDELQATGATLAALRKLILGG